MSGDIGKRPLGFRIRKVLRYARLYGWRRTRMKVRAERHMHRRFRTLPSPAEEYLATQRIGFLGCGRFAYSTLAYFLRQRYGKVIAACMDKDIHRAASMARAYGAPLYSDDAQAVIDSDAVELVFIASNHASHADYAIRTLEEGKHVYIEKPPVVNEEQLQALLAAMARSTGKVFLGYNRPLAPMGAEALAALRAESGPGVYNWFVAGMQLDADHWYLQPGEGGRILGNLCHWTDYLWHLFGADAYPIEVIPVRAEKPDEDLAVGYRTACGTIAVITLSATGYAFEGVRERFSAQRGEAATRGFAQQLADQLNRGGDFRAAVRRHSASASARNGGEIGWIPEGSLPPAVVSAVEEAGVGRVTAPIPVPGAVALLKVLETRNIRIEGANTVSVDVLALSVQDRDPIAAVARLDSVLSQGPTCETAEGLAQAAGVTARRGEPRPIASLPEQVRSVVAGMQQGGVSAPVPVQGGAAAFILCQRIEGLSPEERDRVRARMRQERFVRFSNAYLQELRADAVIERR